MLNDIFILIERWFGTDLGDQFTTVWDLYIHYLAMSKRRWHIFFLVTHAQHTLGFFQNFIFVDLLTSGFYRAFYVITKFRGKYPTIMTN